MNDHGLNRLMALQLIKVAHFDPMSCECGALCSSIEHWCVYQVVLKNISGSQVSLFPPKFCFHVSCAGSRRALENTRWCRSFPTSCSDQHMYRFPMFTGVRTYALPGPFTGSQKKSVSPPLPSKNNAPGRTTVGVVSALFGTLPFVTPPPLCRNNTRCFVVSIKFWDFSVVLARGGGGYICASVHQISVQCRFHHIQTIQ